MNSTMNANASNSFQQDPFAAIEGRRVADWKNLLLAKPELLEGLPDRPPSLRADESGESDTPPEVPPQNSPQSVIRWWDEIPDVLAVTVPGTEWMVPGILPRASVTLLAGEPGSYKTWLALALLRGVASGGDFLGRRCAQASVLYLDRENPLAVVRERLAVLGVEPLGGSRIWGGWLPDAPPAIGDIRTLEIARQHRPLIIFDSLIRFHGSERKFRHGNGAGDAGAARAGQRGSHGRRLAPQAQDRRHALSRVERHCGRR